MQPSSKFAAAYSKGINKLNYWEPNLEDSIDIIAKLPGIAALIYRNTYKGGDVIEADPKLDWAANLSHQMGPCHCSCPCCTLSACSLPACLHRQWLHPLFFPVFQCRPTEFGCSCLTVSVCLLDLPSL